MSRLRSTSIVVLSLFLAVESNVLASGDDLPAAMRFAVESALDDHAFEADRGAGVGAHRDQVQAGLAPLRELAAVEERLLAGLRSVVGEQDSLVHRWTLRGRRRGSEHYPGARAPERPPTSRKSLVGRALESWH